MHAGNLHPLRRHGGAEKFRIAGNCADLPFLARALDVNLARHSADIHLLRVAGDKLIAGNRRHRHVVRAGADRHMTGYRRHLNAPGARLNIRFQAHAAGRGVRLNSLRIHPAQQHVAGGRVNPVCQRTAARHANGDLSAVLVKDGEERLEHIRISAADDELVVFNRRHRFAVHVARFPKRFNLIPAARGNLHVVCIQLNINLANAGKRKQPSAAEGLVRVAHGVFRFFFVRFLFAAFCAFLLRSRLMDDLLSLARHVLHGSGERVLIDFSVRTDQRLLRRLFHLRTFLSLRDELRLLRLFVPVGRFLCGGFLFRLLRPKVKHELALIAGKPVNRLACRALRIAHALPGRAAQLAQHAAGRLVHALSQLSGLRHDGLRKIAQRGERLVERFAQIGLRRVPLRRLFGLFL